MPFVAGQKVRAADLNAGLPAFGRVTADVVVNNSATFVNATGLVVAVEANSVYAVDGFIAYTSGTIPDIKLCLVGPAGAGGRWGGHGLQAAAADNTDSFDAFAAAGLGTGNLVAFGGAGTGTPVFARLGGHITTAGTAGTLQLQFAQLTANASATTVMTGSWMNVYKIA